MVDETSKVVGTGHRDLAWLPIQPSPPNLWKFSKTHHIDRDLMPGLLQSSDYIGGCLLPLWSLQLGYLHLGRSSVESRSPLMRSASTRRIPDLVRRALSTWEKLVDTKSRLVATRRILSARKLATAVSEPCLFLTTGLSFNEGLNRKPTKRGRSSVRT